MQPRLRCRVRRLEERFQHLIKDVHEQECVLLRGHGDPGGLHGLLRQSEAWLWQPSEVHEAEALGMDLECPEFELLAPHITTPEQLRWSTGAVRLSATAGRAVGSGMAGISGFDPPACGLCRGRRTATRYRLSGASPPSTQTQCWPEPAANGGD